MQVSVLMYTKHTINTAGSCEPVYTFNAHKKAESLTIPLPTLDVPGRLGTDRFSMYGTGHMANCKFWYCTICLDFTVLLNISVI
jgi:hypothetical protein